MKKIIVLSAVLLMSTSPALAQKWKHLGNYDDTTSYFFNPKTFSISKDQIVSTWTKKEFGVDQAAMASEKLGPDMYKGKKSVVAYEEFDCDKHKKRTVTGISYENDHGKKSDIGKTGRESSGRLVSPITSRQITPTRCLK